MNEAMIDQKPKANRAGLGQKINGHHIFIDWQWFAQLRYESYKPYIGFAGHIGKHASFIQEISRNSNIRYPPISLDVPAIDQPNLMYSNMQIWFPSARPPVIKPSLILENAFTVAELLNDGGLTKTFV